MIMKGIKPAILISFIDVAFNIAIFMAIMFILAILQFNPVEDTAKGEINSPDTLLVTLNWNDKSVYDVDIYVLAPNGEIINYKNPDQPWGSLERDDIGIRNDEFIQDNITYSFNYNREVVHLRNMADGKYYVNVHLYKDGYAQTNRISQDISVDFVQLEPDYQILFKKQFPLSLTEKEEFTLFSFDYAKGKAINVDTMTQNLFVQEYVKKIKQ
jgi:hypothetical protein